MAEQIIPPLPPVNPAPKISSAVSAGSRAAQNAGPGFAEILQEKIGPEVKISAHAQKRLLERGINLTPVELAKVCEAVDKAQAKGCRDSLIVLDRVALVVSVKNQTVVTAVDAQSMKENVFTNIDSAVFLRNK